VAEVTVFMGGWSHGGADNFYRIVTIIACASIVVTAVYILRAVGKAVMGPLASNDHSLLADARWNERWAAALLIIGIVAIGVAPFWLNDLITPATETIVNKISAIVK
jgi:NADH-quinone oxidoreductase subunit M